MKKNKRDLLNIFRRPQQARQPGAAGGAGGPGSGPGAHRGPKKEPLQPANIPVAKSMFEIFFFICIYVLISLA